MALRVIMLALMFLLACGGAASADNLLPNSSFELGLGDVASPGDFALVKASAAHGQYSAATSQKMIYFLPFTIAKLPQTVTFSVSVKTSGGAGKIRLAMYETASKNAMGQPVNVSGSWTRVSFTTSLSPYAADQEFGRDKIYTPAILNLSGLKLLVDSVQVAPGNGSGYEPRNALEVGSWSDKYANLFVDEAVSLQAAVSNYTSAKREVRVSCEIKDYTGETVFSSNWDASLAPGTVHVAPVKPGIVGYGNFRLMLTARDKKSGENASHIATFSRIPQISSSPAGRFGIHTNTVTSNDSALRDARWKVLNQTGVGWVRLFMSWARVEETKGSYNWSLYDDEIATATKHGKRVLLVLHTRVPGWAKGRGDNPGQLDLSAFMSDRMRFLTACAKRYSRQVGVWEILNEPYWFYDASKKKGEGAKFLSDYLAFQKQVYSLLKQTAPSATVLANVAGLSTNAKDFEFLDALVGQGGLASTDGLSLHLYPANYSGAEEFDLYTKTEAFIRGALAKGGKPNMPIWQTEFGQSSDDQFDDTRRLYTEYRQHMKKNAFGLKPEAEAARSLVRGAAFKASMGVVNDIYFLLGYDAPYENLFTMLKGRWGTPKAILPAFVTLNKVIGEGSFAGKKVKDREGLKLYQFSGRQGSAVLYWSDAKKPGTLTFSVAGISDSVTLLDMMGNKLKPTQAGNTVSLPLDGVPRYLVLGPSVKGSVLERFGQ